MYEGKTGNPNGFLAKTKPTDYLISQILQCLHTQNKIHMYPRTTQRITHENQTGLKELTNRRFQKKFNRPIKKQKIKFHPENISTDISIGNKYQNFHFLPHLIIFLKY